ncbi:MAG: hypothetical protein HYR85_23575 [Planctomycetes bacterium]|nr:hypothetical protein [Planctomycetota bacterium]MBI3845392.1 hypothetical protein [Planctomycetota bacterium]
MKKWGVVSAFVLPLVLLVGVATAQHHGSGRATLLIQPEFAHAGETLVFSLDSGGGGMGMAGDEFALYGALAPGRTALPGGMMGSVTLDLGSPRLIARGTFDSLGHATARAALPSGSIQRGRLIYFQFVTIEDMMGRDVPMTASNVDTVTIVR